MRTQPMVYDSSIETPLNEVEYMLSQCQKSIDDKNNTWAFMLRQLVDVFIIMAFDKLKSRSDDLTCSAQQCEAMVSDFEGAISTLDVNEDMSQILLNQFTGYDTCY
jgi:hypothetical protein